MATERTDYPDDIEIRAWRCKLAWGMRCVMCDARGGEEYINARGQPARKVVTAAHLFHDPSNPSPRLTCLCRECHRIYDARTKPYTAGGCSCSGMTKKKREGQCTGRARKEAPG